MYIIIGNSKIVQLTEKLFPVAAPEAQGICFNEYTLKQLVTKKRLNAQSFAKEECLESKIKNKKITISSHSYHLSKT